MTKRLFDFLSSIIITIAGVLLLFLVVTKFTAKPVQKMIAKFPVSQPRIFKADNTEVIDVAKVSRPLIPLPKNKLVYDGVLTASATLVVDDKTNAVLYAKGADQVRPLASISKLMSALVLSELPMQWNSTTVITAEDVDTSSHHISVGEKYYLKDLWNIALVGSSNSAIQSLVRASGLTIEQFAKKMNEKASSLGLNSMEFVEPTGLNSKNIGNCFDIAKLLRNALKDEKVCEALGIGELQVQPLNKNFKRQIWTTDWLLTNWVPNSFNKNLLVGKTGYIGESGYNFAVRIPGRNGHDLRVIVLGATSNEARFSEARDLANWVFANFVWPDEPNYPSPVE